MKPSTFLFVMVALMVQSAAGLAASRSGATKRCISRTESVAPPFDVDAWCRGEPQRLEPTSAFSMRAQKGGVERRWLCSSTTSFLATPRELRQKVEGPPKLVCVKTSTTNLSAKDAPITVYLHRIVGRGVSPAETRVIEALVTTALGGIGRVNLLAAQDVQAQLNLGEAMASMNCQDASCLADIARATNARYIVSGALNAEERSRVLQLRLFDEETGNVVAREELRRSSVLGMRPALRTMTNNLLSSVTEEAPTTLEPPVLQRRIADSDVRNGGGLAFMSVCGASALASIAIVGCALAAVVSLPGLFVPFFSIIEIIFAPGGCILIPCGAAAGGVASGVADGLAGYEWHWGKMLTVAATSLLAGSVVFFVGLVTGGAGASIVGELAGLSRQETAPFQLVALIASAMLGTAASASVAGVSYALSPLVFDDVATIEVAAHEAPTPQPVRTVEVEQPALTYTGGTTTAY